VPRPEGHPDADLGGSTDDAVGHHAIETERREQKSGGAEEARELGDEPFLDQARVHHVGHRPQVKHLELGIDALYRYAWFRRCSATEVPIPGRSR
jgi:hypothetical protein